MSDVQVSMKELEEAPSGTIDPFENLYYLVCRVTMRIVGCEDIAEDPVLLKKTLGLYKTIEESSTAATIMFPWFPSPAIIKRTIAGGQLYMLVKKIVDDRVASGRNGNDPLQYMIDDGDSMPRIIEVCSQSPLHQIFIYVINTELLSS